MARMNAFNSGGRRSTDSRALPRPRLSNLRRPGVGCPVNSPWGRLEPRFRSGSPSGTKACGFGKSSQPTTGYDYDTFAADLDKLLTALDLQGVYLAGHSMGGGEIARYLGRYGSARVRRAVIISGIPPYLLKTPETPNGAPQEVFDQIAAALTADRAAYFTDWNKNFFNLDETLGKLISAEAVQDAWNLAVSASPEGTIACVATWHTDFRADLPKIDIPVLVLHGTQDRVLPIEACGPRTAELIPGSEFVAIEGASHGLCWTHADEINTELLRFFR